MSFVVAHPEALATVAGHLHGVGSALAARNTASEPAITRVPPGAVHELLVAASGGASAGLYAATEAANTIAAGRRGNRP